MKKAFLLFAIFLCACGQKMPLPVASYFNAHGKLIYSDFKAADPQIVTIRKEVVVDYQCVSNPGNPPAGNIRVYCDSGTGNFTCLTSAGASCVSSSGGGVTSFNSRTGAVTPQTGDYTATNVGLGNVPNVDATNATNISSGTLNSARLPTLTGSNFANFAANTFFGNNTGSSAAAAASSLGASDTEPNTYIAGAGSVNAMTATYVPAVTALTAGLRVKVLPNLANTTTNPTFAPNSLTAKTITKFGALPLVAGDLSTTQVADLVYDGTQWQLLNPVFRALDIVSLATQGFAVFNTAATVNLIATGHPAGMYRISNYFVVTTTFTTCSTINITYGYTDGQSATTINRAVAALTAGSKLSNVNDTDIFSDGTAAITYQPNKTGSSCGAGAGSFYISIERVL